MDRIVAEYRDPKLTGEGAMQRFSREHNRDIERLEDGEFQFVDGLNIYKPVMVAGGWNIVVTAEGGL